MQNLVSDPNPNPNYTAPETGTVGANFLRDESGAPIPVNHSALSEVYSLVNRAEELKRAQQQAAQTVHSSSVGAYNGKQPVVDPNLS